MFTTNITNRLLLPFGWSSKNKKLKKLANVNSLIYKDYALVETEVGSRTYVSPGDKARIMLEREIKDVTHKREEDLAEDVDSTSDSGYEVPVKPQSWNDFPTCTPGKPLFPRQASFPFLDCEVAFDDAQKINLPFNMEPFDVNLNTFKASRRKAKKNKKNNDKVNDSKEESGRHELDSSREKKAEKTKHVKQRILRLWGVTSREKKFSDRQTSKETTVKELMVAVDEEEEEISTSPRFFSRTHEKPQTENQTEVHMRQERAKPEVTNGVNFGFKLSKSSFIRGKGQKNEERADDTYWSNAKNESASTNETTEESENDADEGSSDVPSRESTVKEEMRQTSISNTIIVNDDRGTNLTDSEPSCSRERVLVDGNQSGSSQTTEPDRFSYVIKFSECESMKPRERNRKYRNKIDPNPLRNMFSRKTGNGRTRIAYPLTVNKNSEIDRSIPSPLNLRSNNPFDDVPSCSNLADRRSEPNYPFRGDAMELPWASNNVGGSSYCRNDPKNDRFRYEVTFDGKTPNISDEVFSKFFNNPINSLTSDTESADHGSADKSSMSKLTDEKQPKKLMSDLFGSFKMGKSREKTFDNSVRRNSPSFEVSVKENPDEVQVEVTRPEGIVYAELDMARSPGNVMRRDDEKTEYAEIIYPTSKVTSERAKDELRKSRENLTASRENLAEAEEGFTTTPDGKKEAAV